MPYCSNCRTFIPDGVDTCPKCGTRDTRYTNPNPPPNQQNTYSQPNKQGGVSAQSTWEKLGKLFKTNDLTSTFNSSDISTNKNNAVLAYIGPLVIIPLITSRKSKFAMFHSCQGIVNMVVSILVSLIMMAFGAMPPIISALLMILPSIVLVLCSIFMLLGIVNALRGKAITLPVVGRIDLMRVFFKNL